MKINSNLAGHLVVWGIIVALACGAVAWEMGQIWGLRPGAYNEVPIKLTWQLASGQEELVANIRGFRIYYTTLEDKKLSEKQVQGVSANVKNPYAEYAVELPPRVTGFRFDSYCQDRKSAYVTKPPRLAAIKLGGEDVLGHHLKPQFEPNFRFSSYRYSVPLSLNGWGTRLIPAAILVWLLCMTGLYFLLRKSLSRQ